MTEHIKVRQFAGTPLHAPMAKGHLRRKGHELDAVQVSDDGGELWRIVRLCCGETIPGAPEGWSTEFLDSMDPKGNCPGFRLWRVVGTDGNRYLMAGDHEGGVKTRLFFRTIGAVDVASIELVGDNPDVAAWDAARA